MTTIAWDGSSVAVDSRVNLGNDYMDTISSKAMLVHGVPFFGSGIASIVGQLAEVVYAAFFEANYAELEALASDSRLGHLTSASVLFHHDNCLFEAALFKSDEHYFMEVHGIRGVYAIGSGAKAAYKALVEGSDALEAVRTAISRDPHSGGAVKIYPLTVDAASPGAGISTILWPTLPGKLPLARRLGYTLATLQP